MEAEAVEAILRRVESGMVQWIGGVVVQAEVSRNPHVQKRADALALLAFANEHPKLSPGAIKRATSLEQYGYGAFDALHLALAEAAQVDVLLTTDDRFMKQAERGLGKPAVSARNPLDWLQESGV
jgi:predicted nucleic acid-binding protein